MVLGYQFPVLKLFWELLLCVIFSLGVTVIAISNCEFGVWEFSEVFLVVVFGSLFQVDFEKHMPRVCWDHSSGTSIKM